MCRWQWPKLLIRCSRPGVQRRPHATVLARRRCKRPRKSLQECAYRPQESGSQIGSRTKAAHYESQAGRLVESHHASTRSPSSGVVWLRPASWPPAWLPTVVSLKHSREQPGSLHALELSLLECRLENPADYSGQRAGGLFAKCLAPVLEVSIQVGINARIACCADPRDLSKRFIGNQSMINFWRAAGSYS